MTELVETGAGTAANGDQTSSAGAWFARGERVGSFAAVRNATRGK
jgi:hypothetical protein